MFLDKTLLEILYDREEAITYCFAIFGNFVFVFGNYTLDWSTSLKISYSLQTKSGVSLTSLFVIIF